MAQVLHILLREMWEDGTSAPVVALGRGQEAEPILGLRYRVSIRGVS